jgi:hypothetical protein
MQTGPLARVLQRCGPPLLQAARTLIRRLCKMLVGDSGPRLRAGVISWWEIVMRGWIDGPAALASALPWVTARSFR